MIYDGEAEKHMQDQAIKIKELTQERDGLQAELTREKRRANEWQEQAEFAEKKGKEYKYKLEDAHRVFGVESDQIGAIVKRLESERDALQVNLNWFNVEEFKKMEDDLAEAKKKARESEIMMIGAEMMHKNAVKTILETDKGKIILDLESRLSLMQTGLRSAHTAIDNLFAMLIATGEDFYPRKSGQPWKAMLEINSLLSSAAVEPKDKTE